MSLVRSTHGRPGCPICGEPGRACGGHTTTPGINPLRTEETYVSGEPVYEYDVEHNGYDTIMNLTETQATRDYPDAKRRSGPVAADHPEHADAARAGRSRGGSGKARTAPNKSDDPSSSSA